MKKTNLIKIRNSWGALRPVTKIKDSKKKYNRPDFKKNKNSDYLY